MINVMVKGLVILINVLEMLDQIKIFSITLMNRETEATVEKRRNIENIIVMGKEHVLNLVGAKGQPGHRKTLRTVTNSKVGAFSHLLGITKLEIIIAMEIDIVRLESAVEIQEQKMYFICIMNQKPASAVPYQMTRITKIKISIVMGKEPVPNLDGVKE